MGKTDLFLEDFDPETLSGQAKVGRLARNSQS